jgi:hypothetical protein
MSVTVVGEVDTASSSPIDFGMSLSKRIMDDDESKGSQERNGVSKKQKLSQEGDKENQGNGGSSVLKDVLLSKQQLAVAEKLARQLHEMEKKKLEEQKRKKSAEESWMKTVRK